MHKSDNKVFLVGLTGGIGAGKSSVAQLFSTAGWPTLDTDALAHELLQSPDATLRHGLAALFGESILGPDAAVDRRKLGSLVFDNPQALQQLEGLMHPAIERLMNLRLTALLQQGRDRCLVEIPLLVEAGWDKKVHWVVTVDAPTDIQIHRASARLGLPPDQIRSRINAQASPAQRAAVAHFVIHNSGTMAELESETFNCLEAAQKAYQAWSTTVH